MIDRECVNSVVLVVYTAMEIMIILSAGVGTTFVNKVRDSLLTLPQFNPFSFSFFSNAFSDGLFFSFKFSSIFLSPYLVQIATRNKKKI